MVSLSDAMADPGPDLPFSEEARVRFARFASEIRILRRRLSEPVLDVLHRVISVTGLDVEVAASPKLVAQRSAETLAAFLGRAADFQDLEGDQSVTAFRAYLKAAERHERGIDASLPSQGDSVKLLTMHKSKGLEWDAVFVPHLAGAAQKPRESWIGSGAVLPYPLRGDAEHLPVLDDAGNTAAFKSFKEQAKEYESWEDLRLEYVTVTRPRYYLTASGHWWGPTQKRRRGPDTWLTGLYEHCQDGHGEIVAWAAEPDPDAVNPSLGATEAHWPVLPDAEAAERRRIGAEMVIAALHRRQAEAFSRADRRREPDAGEPQAAEQPDDGCRVPVMRRPRRPLTRRRPVVRRGRRAARGPAARAACRGGAGRAARRRRRARRHRRGPRGHRLLGPRPRSPAGGAQARRLHPALRPAPVLDVGLPAAALPQRPRRASAASWRVPMPQPPAPSARLGTKFHAWIESLFGQQALFEYEDLPGAADEEIADEVDLKELQDAFLRTPWAESVPEAVEQPFQVVLAGRVVRGRIDAVYKTPDGWEVVDWKTSRSHDADSGPAGRLPAGLGRDARGAGVRGLRGVRLRARRRDRPAAGSARPRGARGALRRRLRNRFRAQTAPRRPHSGPHSPMGRRPAAWTAPRSWRPLVKGGYFAPGYAAEDTGANSTHAKDQQNAWAAGQGRDDPGRHLDAQRDPADRRASRASSSRRCRTRAASARTTPRA